MFGNIPAVRLGLVTTENNRKKNKNQKLLQNKRIKRNHIKTITSTTHQQPHRSLTKRKRTPRHRTRNLPYPSPLPLQPHRQLHRSLTKRKRTPRHRTRNLPYPSPSPLPLQRLCLLFSQLLYCVFPPCPNLVGWIWARRLPLPNLDHGAKKQLHVYQRYLQRTQNSNVLQRSVNLRSETIFIATHAKA